MNTKSCLTIGIPTCGRPEAIEGCLSSISRNLKIDHRIIVVDSLITNRNLDIYSKYPEIKCIQFDSPIGPSAARKIIIENTQTPYLLFLDDDNEVTPGSIEKMISYLEEKPHVDIVGAAWREHGDFSKRAIGQYFHFGQSGDKQLVYKSFLGFDDANEMKMTSVKVDVVLATMLIRCKVFERIQFDPRYDFFFELFDFFMQCYRQEVIVHALPQIFFEHKPIAYSGDTLRQKTGSDVDRQKFVEKWGLHPTGAIGFQGHNKSKAKSSFLNRGLKQLGIFG